MKILVSLTHSFEKEIARLNKKASRVGFSPLSYTNLGRRTVKQTRIVIETLEGESREHSSVVPVEVTEYDLVLPDAEQYRWTLRGKLERLEDGSTFVDSRVKGLDLAKWTAANPCHCDHCHTARNRNFTYIIQNKDDGREMQVGRNCFADYIGHEGLLKLEFLDLVFSMFNLGEEEIWPGDERGSRTLPVVSVRRVLAIAEYLYRTHGWTYNQKDPYTGEVIADGTHRQAARYAAGSIPGGKQDVWFAPEITAAADAIIERLQNYEAPADDEFAQALVYAVNFEFLPERKASRQLFSRSIAITSRVWDCSPCAVPSSGSMQRAWTVSASTKLSSTVPSSATS